MSTIYIRTLKHAEHTVFGVEDGQKKYFEPQFRRQVPYSSGQQIKHSFIDRLSVALNQIPSPTTFIFDVEIKAGKKELKEGEVFATCNPEYPDQLLGGWMKASKGGKERTIKRRSPLSISAMHALHPLLAQINNENATFDRSARANNEVMVRDENGKLMTTEEITEFLQGKDRSLVRKWIADQKRAAGLFVHDLAIDLRRLFCVTLNPMEPEITTETENELRGKGWIESTNAFGKCLVAPADMREKLIPAIADAILNWRITSNQSRTFSLMETLAVSISNNANKIASSIRAELNDDEEQRAIPVIEEMPGVEIFVTRAAKAHIKTKSDKLDALDSAHDHLVHLLKNFNYEKQL